MVKSINHDHFYEVHDSKGIVYLSWNTSKTVEDMINHELTLTPQVWDKYFK